MEGWIDGKMDSCEDGWKDGQMVGWSYETMERYKDG